MKVGIIYSAQHRKLENIAKALGKTLEHGGHRVDYLHISRNDRPPNVRNYDVVYLGSITEGTFGGKIPGKVSDFIKQCRGFQNSKTATFIVKRIFGNNKGMKRMMALLESMGSRVTDFQIIGGKADIEALGNRLKL